MITEQWLGSSLRLIVLLLVLLGGILDLGVDMFLFAQEHLCFALLLLLLIFFLCVSLLSSVCQGLRLMLDSGLSCKIRDAQ